MRFFLVTAAFAFLVSCAGYPSMALAQATQFRGHAEIEKILSHRLAPADKPLTLLPYVGNQYGLLNLLGSWAQSGGVSVFSNGLPNAVNMLIWYSSLHGIAKDLGAKCTQSNGLAINAEFAKTLQTICAWPADSAKSESTMLAFWLGIMDYSAPEEEFQAWRAFFLNSSYQNKSAGETVSAMSLSILMSPFLLLQN